MLSLTALGQSKLDIGQSKPNVTTAIIGNDTVFVMNREFAELVASRFDSLQSLKQSFSECVKAVDMLETSVDIRNKLITNLKNLSDNKQSEIMLLNRKIESLETSIYVYKDVEKQLKAETKKRKTWAIIAGIGGIAGISGILFGVLK